MMTEFDQKNTGNRNRGFKFERTKHNDLERAFAQHWEEENKKRPGINFGHGILQDLFFDFSSLGGLTYRCVHCVTPMERYVTATAIQWLGSNVGFGFLTSCLRGCGLKIVTIKDGSPPAPPEGARNPYTRKFA